MTLVHTKTGLLHVGPATIQKAEHIKLRRENDKRHHIGPGEDVEQFYVCRARIMQHGGVVRRMHLQDRFTFFEWWRRCGTGAKWLVLKDDRGWYILTDVTRTLRDENFRLHMFQPEFFSDRDAAIMAGVLRL